MSVWPISLSTSPLLTGSEGALVLVSIHAEPRLIESLLDALAQVDFPINPQIYHNASMSNYIGSRRSLIQMWPHSIN